MEQKVIWNKGKGKHLMDFLLSLRYPAFCYVDALLDVGVEVLLVVVQGEFGLGFSVRNGYGWFSLSWCQLVVPIGWIRDGEGSRG